LLYLLIVNYYSCDFIKKIIEQLRFDFKQYKLLIVDNSANLLLQEIPAIYGNIKILDTKENLGFGKACNLGLTWIYKQHSQALVWLINPDTFCPYNTVSKAISFFEKYPELSILGTLDISNKVQKQS
jgi:GT2 family glycosyltransferase